MLSKKFIDFWSLLLADFFVHKLDKTDLLQGIKQQSQETADLKKPRQKTNTFV